MAKLGSRAKETTVHYREGHIRPDGGEIPGAYLVPGFTTMRTLAGAGGCSWTKRGMSWHGTAVPYGLGGDRENDIDHFRELVAYG